MQILQRALFASFISVLMVALWNSCLPSSMVAMGMGGAFAATNEDTSADVAKDKDTKKEKEGQRHVWQQLRPERLVSEDALFFISTPDLSRLKTAFAKTALNGLLNEEEIVNPVLATFTKLKEAYIKGDSTRSEMEIRRRGDEVALLLKLIPLLDGNVALAVNSLPAANQNTRLPKFLVVASMPTEDRQRELEVLLDKHRYSQTTDPHFRDLNDRVGPYDVYHMENNDLNLKETWAFVENLFIYGQGDKVVEEAIERYTTKNGAGTLSLNVGYQGAFKEVGRDERGESLLYLQADFRAILNVLPNFSEIAKTALTEGPMAAELNATRPHVALGLQIGEGVNAPIRERILVRMPKGVLPVKSPEPFRSVGARFAQSDTLFFTASQFNLAEAVKSVLSRKFLGYLKDLTGAATEADISGKLDMFKGESAFFVSYVAQPSLKFDNIRDFFETFQMVLAVELDRDVNEVAFRDLMTHIEVQTKQTYLPLSVKDVIVRYQKGAAPREERGPLQLGLLGGWTGSAGSTGSTGSTGAGTEAQDTSVIPFFQCYARVELETEAGGQPRKFLLLSDNLNALRKAVQQSRSMRSSLAEDSRFVELQKALRANRYDFNYVNLSKMVDIYSGLLPYFGRANLLSRETLSQMPSATALRPHLFPMAWGCTHLNEPESLVVETYSPTGNLPLLTLLGLTAWPVVVDRRAELVSREIDGNFRQVMLGLHLYAADFDRFPQQLSDLYPTYVKDLAFFESPLKRGLVKQAQDIDSHEFTNMVYVPSHALQDMGNEVLLYEKEPTRLTKTSEGSHRYYHVVTMDGKRKWLTKPALELRLAGRVDFLTRIADKSAPAELPTAAKPSKP